MKVNNKTELQHFFEKNCPEEGSYAIVTYCDGGKEAIWISVFKDWTVDEDGNPRNWYLEAPNVLFRTELEEPYEESIFDYAEELYEEVDEILIKSLMEMVIDGYLYEVDSMQTSPFLPEQLNDIKLVTERECLEWMLKNDGTRTW